MKLFLISVAALHAIFMLCELFPWPFPVLLQIVSKKLPDAPVESSAISRKWFPAQHALVATIVHNAGIYNGILAGGLLWAAVTGVAARDVAQVLLIGAAVAGIFGTVTLKSPITALQALLGIVGFLIV